MELVCRIVRNTSKENYCSEVCVVCDSWRNVEKTARDTRHCIVNVTRAHHKCVSIDTYQGNKIIHNQHVRWQILRNYCLRESPAWTMKKNVNFAPWGIRQRGIHKLRHTLRGVEGVDEVWHCVTRGGGILKFVTSHFKNSFTRINQIVINI